MLCFEPYSENRRFSEWVDPDGVATKTKGTPCGVPLFSLVSRDITKSNLYGILCFLSRTRFNPSKNTTTHTAEPRVAFIITISVSVIPSNDTSIERCNANIDTKASAKDMFRSVMSIVEVLRRDFIRLIVASVILVKAYVAMAIITIIWNF